MFELRKIVTITEDTYREGGRSCPKIIHKCAVMAVIKNDGADQYFEDLQAFIDEGDKLGEMLTTVACEILGRENIESFGKGAIVGLDGEIEHGAAMNHVKFGNAMRRALVVGAERLSRITDWTDRATCVLFGDGAGAVVLEWDESAPGILASFLKNTDDDTLCLTVDANHDMSTFPFGENVGNVGVGEIMDIETDEGGFAEHAAFIRMHGQRVFKFATAAIVEAARAVCERAGVSMDEVSCIVPHQANDRIIRFAAKKLGVPYERWQVSIAEAGNTSASSVLMALSDAYDEGRIQPGDKVMCVGFGGGLTSGALLFEA